MLGGLHLRTLTLLGFPSLSRPGCSMRSIIWISAIAGSTRFIALDKAEATKALTRLRRHWFNKRKRSRPCCAK